MLGFGSAHLVLFQRASPQLLVVSTVLKSSLFYPASEKESTTSVIYTTLQLYLGLNGSRALARE